MTAGAAAPCAWDGALNYHRTVWLFRFGDQLMACNRCTYTPFSLVLPTTYKVRLARLMAGVPVIPISGTRSLMPTSAAGTVVTPLAAAPYAGVSKLICQRGCAFPPALLSASNA